MSDVVLFKCRQGSSCLCVFSFDGTPSGQSLARKSRLSPWLCFDTPPNRYVELTSLRVFGVTQFWTSPNARTHLKGTMMDRKKKASICLDSICSYCSISLILYHKWDSPSICIHVHVSPCLHRQYQSVFRSERKQVCYFVPKPRDW